MSDTTGLCLQDLVGANSGAGGDHHIHNHSLHDSVSASVSVSSAIPSLMSVGGTANLGLNHHIPHHTSHDLMNHLHPHSILPQTALHEPLEKLKCKFLFISLFL